MSETARHCCVYDLHTHTLCSDGTLTPTELVRRAAANGVNVLALTDHDVTDGIDEARAAARDADLALVPGVEISVSWGAHTVHVVGLRIDIDNPALQCGLRGLRAFRAWRATEIGRRLEKSGIGGAYEGACAYATGALISRTHFARYLVDAGHARDVRQVFKRFLVSGKPGHVPGEWATLAEAVDWIRAAGGEAVMAHPGRYKLSSGRLRALFGEFRECGGSAIEVVSGCHSRDDYFRFAHLATQFGLLASAGSDYHGPENPWMDLGPMPPLPVGCTPVWHAW